MPPRKETLPIGVIARAHGVRGELRVHLYDPASRALDGARRVLIGGAPHAVAGARRVHEAYLLTLDQVADRDGADALRGREVEVYRADLPPLAEGEFLIADLVGLRAEDAAGRALGEVVEIQRAGAQDLAVVVHEDEERLIPVVPELVLEVGDERVVFALPEDLPVQRRR